MADKGRRVAGRIPDNELKPWPVRVIAHFAGVAIPDKGRLNLENAARS